MHIVVYGAGSIGCYLGAALQLEGLRVTLIGRQRIADEIRANGGIRISDYLGSDQQVTDIRFETSVAALSDADIVLVTLKCLAMEQASEAILHYCRPGTRIICLQNGLGSDQPLRRQPHDLNIQPGITGFNVVHCGTAHFHRATEGDLSLTDDDALQPLQTALQEQRITVKTVQDFDAVIWAKLQLNLNNAINALSGIPLKEQLLQRGYRRLLAQAMKEAASVAASKGIRPAQLTALPPRLLPYLINSPDFLFRRLAGKMLAIDPQARSSMWEDLQQQRPTEIYFINGAIVAEAEKLGIATPVNRALCRLIHEVETGRRQPGMSAEALQQAVYSSGHSLSKS